MGFCISTQVFLVGDRTERILVWSSTCLRLNHGSIFYWLKYCCKEKRNWNTDRFTCSVPHLLLFWEQYLFHMDEGGEFIFVQSDTIVPWATVYWFRKGEKGKLNLSKSFFGNWNWECSISYHPSTFYLYKQPLLAYQPRHRTPIFFLSSERIQSQKCIRGKCVFCLRLVIRKMVKNIYFTLHTTNKLKTTQVIVLISKVLFCGMVLFSSDCPLLWALSHHHPLHFSSF